MGVQIDGDHRPLVENQIFVKYIEDLRRKFSVNHKVLLLQVPQFLLDTFNPEVVKNKGYYAYPPTGLQCIKKALSDRDLEIDILDLNFSLLKRLLQDPNFNHLNWLDLLDEYLEENDPSIIGVTGISVSTFIAKKAS